MIRTANDQRCGVRRSKPPVGDPRSISAAPLTSRLVAQVCVRRATPADGPQMQDLLSRRGHGGDRDASVAIVATLDERVVAVAVGSTPDEARNADCAVEPEWVGLGLGAALGRALGEALCATSE
jgi:hypothetical protein